MWIFRRSLGVIALIIAAMLTLGFITMLSRHDPKLADPKYKVAVVVVMSVTAALGIGGVSLLFSQRSEKDLRSQWSDERDRFPER